MQFNKVKMQLNDFCKHAEDKNAILNHARANMQFYNVKMQLNDAVQACRGPKCKNKIKQGKSAMQFGKIKN